MMELAGANLVLIVASCHEGSGEAIQAERATRAASKKRKLNRQRLMPARQATASGCTGIQDHEVRPIISPCDDGSGGRSMAYTLQKLARMAPRLRVYIPRFWGQLQSEGRFHVSVFPTLVFSTAKALGWG